MSTDSQNPRYSYLTLNRSIVGTDSFELMVFDSGDPNASDTISIHINVLSLLSNLIKLGA